MDSHSDFALWLLRAILRRTPKDLKKVSPTSTLTGLELDELDLKGLTNSLRAYVKRRRPAAKVTRAAVDAAKNVRGLLKLMVTLIEEGSLSDADADSAIDAAKETIANE